MKNINFSNYINNIIVAVYPPSNSQNKDLENYPDTDIENNNQNNNISINLTKIENQNEKEDIQNNNNNEKEKILNNKINNNEKRIQNILEVNIFQNVNIYINDESSNKENNIKKYFLNKKRKKTFEVEKKIYIPDCYLKQIRSLILDSLIDFINNKIKKFKNNKIKLGICKLQFLPINKEDLYHSNVEFDKQFLNLKLIEILSWNLNKKYTNKLNDANSKLVQNLISDENGEYFTELFNLTFLECLECIRGTKNSFLFDGFPKIEEIIANKKNKLNKNDIEKYKYYINNYEISLKHKISRSPKTSKTLKKKISDCSD